MIEFLKINFLHIILFVLADKRRKIKGRSPLQDEPEEEDDYIDEEMKKFDQTAQTRILSIVEDYETDMKNYSGYNTKTERTKSGKCQGTRTKILLKNLISPIFLVISV